ncbi:hypothetical protein Godav_023468, partial [Gossypium davidsonii]|nr:hypothetical protein [Gossypium davidsonii]MBA0664505.1 hypothetical protein [Gossypium klotzschianum]
ISTCSLSRGTRRLTVFTQCMLQCKRMSFFAFSLRYDPNQ